ncbi:unnamed protein product [Clonostachys rosea]|uniref:Transcription factor domain-containing protein n=1 Tax=Bionectria ochroleuca TaxID=29856 RepID=A0ABY6UBH0_BIOOC|nr:unnamed protein product [Clonostachys rosea]
MARDFTIPISGLQVLMQDANEKFEARQYKTRKTHLKSRGGCGSCKLKRVKGCFFGHGGPKTGIIRSTDCAWDGKYSVMRPSRHVNAVYELAPDASIGTQMTTAPSPRKPRKRIPTLYHHTLTENQPASPFGTPRFTLLRHFYHVFAQLDMFEGVSTDPIVSLALSRPHLMNAMLAVSASHLRCHATTPVPSHRVAEHYQQSLAVRGFQTALEESWDPLGADALLMTSMLLNLLTFSIIEDEDPWKSWVFSDDPNRLSWLGLHLGMKPLIISTAAYRKEGTMLQWMFDVSDDDKRTFNGTPQPLTRVPQAWIDLCGISPDQLDCPDPDHVFYEPVRILGELRDMEPRYELMFIYVSFVGKLDNEFRRLLELGNPAAMWLFGYWLGLVARFNFWWCNNRVRRDHRAICIWFELRGFTKRVGAEGEMWRELLFDLDNAPVWPSPRRCRSRTGTADGPSEIGNVCVEV